jgi:pimeloyl-ACP methyl ester carboxylesterase
MPTADRAPTLWADGKHHRFAYRRFGVAGGPPLVLANRFRGTLDHWDPAFLDLLAAGREVILFDNAGVGLTSGATDPTIAGMAETLLEFLSALRLEQVDLLGWSMGGFVVQQVTLQHPDLVRRLIVAGSGPGAVPGTPPASADVWRTAAKPVNTDEDFLAMFFPSTAAARALGLASLRRLEARLLTSNAVVAPPSVAAQSAALQAWGRGEATAWQRLEELTLPMLIAGGAQDILMHPFGSYSMAGRLANAKLVLYSDAGHAFLFQHADDFTAEVLAFLR